MHTVVCFLAARYGAQREPCFAVSSFLYSLTMRANTRWGVFCELVAVEQTVCCRQEHSNAQRWCASLPLAMVLNANPALQCLLFYTPDHACKHAVGSMCALFTVMHTDCSWQEHSNAHGGVLPCRSQWCSTRTLLCSVFFFILSDHACKHAVGSIKKNTLTSESVRVGRSYRNRTYTVGVRGPSATTTPSSIA